VTGSIAVALIHSSPPHPRGAGNLRSRQPGLRLVGVFASAREVLGQPPQGDHVLLCDLETSHQDGAGLLAELRQRVPQRRRVATLLTIAKELVADNCQRIQNCTIIDRNRLARRPGGRRRRA